MGRQGLLPFFSSQQLLPYFSADTRGHRLLKKGAEKRGYKIVAVTITAYALIACVDAQVHLDSVSTWPGSPGWTPAQCSYQASSRAQCSQEELPMGRAVPACQESFPSVH